jgi:hypothetical protein
MEATTQNNVTTLDHANTEVTVELQKIGVGVLGITSLLCGCWAAACMTAGIIASGGPAGLATNYIKSLIG